MRFILLAVLIAAGAFFFLRETPLDRLMDADAAVASEPGSIARIDPAADGSTAVQDLAAPGRITVVEFHDRSCQACTVSRSNLEKLLNVRPDVAVRLVQVGDYGWRESGRKYGVEIWSVPHTVILEPDGRILAENTREEKAGSALLFEWINAEIARENDRRRVRAVSGR
ncbi:MAG: hypothetical protein PVF91_12490 [Chromatiales bacterium]|jgi:hypothetical protein